MPSVRPGLPASDGCGRELTPLSVFGEYRNVLGEDELGRSEPMLGEKLRGLDARGLKLSAAPLRCGMDPWLNDGPLNDGLGELNEGREGVVWNDLSPDPKDLDGPELNGLEGVAGAGLDGALNDGPDQLGLEPIEGPGLLELIDGPGRLALIDGPGWLDPMDGPESLENDRCMLDDRSDLSLAITGLPNMRIVWGPNRLLAVGEISTAAIITTAAARHLFFLAVNILLLLHSASAKHLPSFVTQTNNHPLHNSTVFNALGFHSTMLRSRLSLLSY
jgi:hypothetical protein